MIPLPAEFYARKTEAVARALLGCRLVRERSGKLQIGVISETEAYVGAHDLACHAAKGRTARTEVLFGPPGRAYVYLIYGMYWCLNAVTEVEGWPAAVLIRSVVPVEGIDRRSDGPGRLTRALAIDKRFDHHDLCAGTGLWICERAKRPARIVSGPRIGVAYAGEWAHKPLRFCLS